MLAYSVEITSLLTTKQAMSLNLIYTDFKNEHKIMSYFVGLKEKKISLYKKRTAWNMY